MILRLTLDDLQEIGVADYEVEQMSSEGWAGSLTIKLRSSKDEFLCIMRNLISLYKSSPLPVNETIH